MKPNLIFKILVITLIGLPVLLKAQVSESFTLTQNELIFQKNAEFDELTIKDYSFTEEIGNPQLPIRIESFVVPYDAVVSGIQVTSVTKQNEIVYYRNDTICLNDCCSLSTNIQQIRNQKQNVRYYPNPTSGKVIIKLPDGNDDKALILTDITGVRKWEKTQLSDNSFELDLSYFDNGIYTLTIRGKNFVSS